MPHSRLFVSSCTRRQLARRRPGRTTLPAQVLIVMILILILAGLAAFIAGRGGL
jgi:hypothetical protein